MLAGGNLGRFHGSRGGGIRLSPTIGTFDGSSGRRRAHGTEGATSVAIGVGILGSGYMGRTYAFGLKEINHDARLVAVAGRHAGAAARGRLRRRRRPDAGGADREAGRRCRGHRHAPLDAPAADARRGRGRKARLPREADGPDRGRVRRDDRRRRPGRRRALRQQDHAPPRRRPDDPPIDRRGRDRRRPDDPRHVPDRRLRRAVEGVAHGSRRGHALARLRRPWLRHRPLAQRRRRRARLRDLPVVPGRAHPRSRAAWSSSSWRTASSPSSG